MPNSLEKDIESKACDKLEAFGCLALKIPARFFAGIPDRIVLAPGGVCFFIEFKRAGALKGSRRGERRQAWVAGKLGDLGFDVYVVDSLSKIDAIIKERF